MYFLPFLNEVKRDGVTHDAFRDFAINAEMPASRILDEVSMFVAQEYLEHRMSFDDADLIMNNVWGLAVALDANFGQITYTVYQAFDAGEYRHSGDGPDVDLEKTYTVPAIKKLLSQLSPTE